jgi:iron complex outermembrane receptor protein
LKRSALAFVCFVSALGAKAQVDTNAAKVETLIILKEHTTYGNVARPSRFYKEQKVEQQSAMPYRTAGLAKMLQEQTSLHVRDYGPSGIASLSIRGTSPSQNKVVWNDLELNSPMLGQADLSVIPNAFATSVSVKHGNSSQFDGLGALGGSIQMESTSNDSQRFQFLAEYQSLENLSVAASSNYKVQKWKAKTALILRHNENRFQFRNVAVSGSPENEMQQAKVQQLGVQQDFSIRLKNNQTLDVNAFYTQSERQVPPLMSANEMTAQKQDDAIGALVVRYKREGRKARFSTSGGAVFNRLDFENPASNLLTRSTSIGLKNRMRYYRQLSRNTAWISTSYVSVDGAQSEGYTETVSQLSGDVFSGLQSEWKALQIMLGLSPKFLNSFVVMPLPLAGLVWNVASKNRIFLKSNFGGNYRFPTLNDRFWFPGGNANLRPESGLSYEAGVKWVALKQEKVNVEGEFTAFRGEINNWIQWQPTNNGFWQAQNVRKVLHEGFEGSLNYHLKVFKLDFNGNVNYSFVRSIDQQSNKQLVYVPEHSFVKTHSVGYKTHSLTLIYRYVGERFTSSANDWYLPAYDILNVGYSKKWSSSKHFIELGVFVNNIFDKRYMDIAWRAQPGRYVSVQVVFSY